MSIRESVGKKKPCRPRCSFTPESKAEIVGLRTVWVLPRTTTHPEEVPFAVHHLRQDEEDDSSALNHQPSATSRWPPWLADETSSGAGQDHPARPRWLCPADRAGAAFVPAPSGPDVRGSRSLPGTGRASSGPAASSAAPGAVRPRLRLRSGRPDAASPSSPSRSPAPGAGAPTGRRCAARTGFRTVPGGPGPAACPPPAQVPARAATAR